MNEHRESYAGMMVGVSLALGTIFTACLLNQYQSCGLAISILNFGNWISSFAGLSGFLPALITASLLGGIIAMCIVASITPQLEEYVAKRGGERSRRTLQQKEGMSIEDERKALVERYGQMKPE